MPREVVLFEGDDIRVTAVPAESATCVVCFSNHQADGQPRRTFGEEYLRRLELAGVFVTAQWTHFWQVPEMAAAMAAARGFARSYADRATFGSSMGGFGALGWAAEVEANRIIAVVPQTTYTDPAVPLDREWRDLLARVRLTRAGIPAMLPVGVEPQVVYDPGSVIDRAHADWLARRRPVARLHVPGAGHGVLRLLKDARLFRPVMGGLLTGSLDAEGFHALLGVATPPEVTPPLVRAFPTHPALLGSIPWPTRGCCSKVTTSE
jgi:hypothetical protein